MEVPQLGEDEKEETSIGFGTLMIASERGQVRLGLMLTLGVGCSLLTALIFLPALLHLRAPRRRPPTAPLEAPAESSLAA